MHLKRWENVSFVVGMVRQNAAILWFVPCQAGHWRTSLHPNLTAFCSLYNQSCLLQYNDINLITDFLFNVYKRFFIFLSRFTFLNVFFNFNMKVLLHLCREIRRGCDFRLKSLFI